MGIGTMKILIIFIAFCEVFGQYEVPDALVEVFRPRGLRVSIPDEEGIKLFAFHAKVNEEMNGREGGTFSRDILKAKNGRWTFYDPLAQLKIGDTLYYWTYVDYFDGKNKLGYTNDDQTFVVTELLEKPGANKPPVKPQQPGTSPTGCSPSITVVNNERKCAGQEIFSEDFSSLRENFWKPEIRFAGLPDYEFVVYQNRPETLSVQNGNLEVRPIPTDNLYGEGFATTSNNELNLGSNCTGTQDSQECVQKADAFLILPPVISSQITTKNKWSFKYGKIEIRAKLPKGDWIYPELFLNPLREDYGSGYESGQIRIAFIGGNSNLANNLQGGCILAHSKAGRTYLMRNLVTGRSWADDFHIFTLIWKDDQIRISVDNQQYGIINAPHNSFASLNFGNHKWREGGKFAPFDKEMFLTIGVGVGGHNFEDTNDQSKPWIANDPKGQKSFYRARNQWGSTWGDDSTLKVDYIKIWAI